MAGVSDEAVTKVALALADEVRKWPVDSSLPYDSRIGVGATFQELARVALGAAQPFMQCSCPHISEVDDYCPQHGRDS